MSLSKALRTAYFQALDGNVLHNGNPVPVYDDFALNNTYPYIIIGSQTGVQEPLKTNKSFNCTILIDIVTGSLDPIGRAQSEDIGEQIENLINPDSLEDITVEGYQVINTQTELDSDLTAKNDQCYIYRKLKRYRHELFKQ